jgi:Domain of unknown function (DUF1906)
VTSVRGCDYSAGPIPPAALVAGGMRYVIRYLSTVGNPKNITAGEMRGLLAAGIPVVLVYETTADWMLGGRDAGAAAASSARAQATSVGWPSGRPVYAAADFDVTPAQIPVALETLQGWADTFGLSATGVYGGYAIIRAALDVGYLWGFQTVAWSGGQWDPRAQLRQTGATAVIGGVQVDVDTAVAADFGQHPAPAAAAAPTAVSTKTTSSKDEAMDLISVSPDPTNPTNKGPGIFSVSGGCVAHVPDTATLSTLVAAFGTPVAVSPAYYQNLLAAQPSVAQVDVAALAAELIPLLPAAPTAEQNAAAELEAQSAAEAGG